MANLQWNQEDIAQSESLCLRCSAIDMSEVMRDTRQLESLNGGLGVGTLIRNLGPVSEWSIDCRLCKVLLASIPEASREHPPENYSLRFHYSQDRRLCIYYPLLKALPPTATILKLDGPDVQAHYVSSPFLVLRDANSSSGVRILKTDSIEFPIVRGWLDLCAECHTETCGSPAVLAVSSLKLIDCKTRTVIRADKTKHQPYVTLSYVCGTINDPPHAPDELPSPAPETIEDAIVVTLNIGLQYLWVDRYCIDQQNLPNKLAQIQQMNLIYSTSEITLIAAAGKDAYYGLPGVKKRTRTQHSYTNLGSYQIVSTLQPIGPVRGTLEHTYWSTRAWCYQEALLSKRRLIFTDEQVYYECHGMSSCEVFDLPYREMHKENGQSFRDEYLHFSTRDIGKFTAGVGKAPYHLFNRIEEYTKKNLSFQSDRLNAFLGILNRFETELHSSRHLWGQPMVPEMDRNYMTETRSREQSKNWYGLGSFVDGLAWGLRGSGGREKDRPSWSWTGWTSPIRYKYIYSTMHVPEEFPMAIIEFETEDGQVLDWDHFQTRYSNVANASQSCRALHITAMTLPICLVEGEDPGYWFEVDMHDGYYLSWPATTSLDESDQAETTWLLQQDLQSDAKLSALMTTISTFSEAPNYLFLLIIAEVDGVTERVGGGWLGPETVLCTPEGDEIQVEEHGEWISGLQAKYGRDWWKDLVKKRGTHRVG